MLHYKRENFKDLAVRLQHVEAEGVLDICCKRISRELPEAPLITIHDSILTTDDYKELVRQIMIEELTKFVGLAPQIKFK